MRPPREQHQVFSIIGPVVAHRVALAVSGSAFEMPIVRSEWYGYMAGFPDHKLAVSIRIPTSVGPQVEAGQPFSRLFRRPRPLGCPAACAVPSLRCCVADPPIP